MMRQSWKNLFYKSAWTIWTRRLMRLSRRRKPQQVAAEIVAEFRLRTCLTPCREVGQNAGVTGRAGKRKDHRTAGAGSLSRIKRARTKGGRMNNEAALLLLVA